MPGRLGVVIVAGCAALGALGTIMTGGQPGALLAVFLLAGTVTAGLVVHQRSAYLLIPAPALAYSVAALVAGLADNPGGFSKTALAIGALQWIAGGFLTMLAATAIAIGVAAFRRWRAISVPVGSRRTPPSRHASQARSEARYDPRPWDDPPSRSRSDSTARSDSAARSDSTARSDSRSRHDPTSRYDSPSRSRADSRSRTDSRPRDDSPQRTDSRPRDDSPQRDDPTSRHDSPAWDETDEHQRQRRRY